jgi:hypothetical protein
MNAIYPKGKKATGAVAVFLSTLLTLPLLNACGSDNRAEAPRSIDNTTGRNVNYPQDANRPQQKPGLSNRNKVLITLAGAAALYYLYNQRKNAEGKGPEGRYYLSKNGRVYYRDAQGRPVWVTPPAGGIRVPESEASRYRDFQGYNGRSDGRDLRDITPREAPAF